MQALKEWILNIIADIKIHTNAFVKSERENIVFENKKQKLLRAMYDPMYKKKQEEIKILLEEEKALKKEKQLVFNKIKRLKDEKLKYEKKIEIFESFHQFLINNRFPKY